MLDRFEELFQEYFGLLSSERNGDESVRHGTIDTVFLRTSSKESGQLRSMTCLLH
jgi:hypothetical protein